jgi:colicin import membrane protein
MTTMAAMRSSVGNVPYRVPPEPSTLPAIGLAVLVHLVLLAFLWIGVSWQSSEPVAIEAEVWDMKVQSAAAPAEPATAPEPEPVPETPPPPPPRPVPREAEPTPVRPDIALEREKEKREQEKREELARQKEEQRKREEQRLADEKRLAEAKKLEDRKKQEEKKLEEKRLAEQKAAKAREAEEKAKLAKLREAELRRIAGAAGAGGEALRATAPVIDSGYLAAIRAKIKSNTSYPGSTSVPGNPRAEFAVTQLPTGEVMGARLTKSSGVPAFDQAVERGILAASPLPKNKDGVAQRNLIISFSMKDLDGN